VYFVAFSPDGRRIVTGSGDKTAKVWRQTAAGTGHAQGAQRCRFFCGLFRDGQRIVTGSYDNTAKVWEEASGQELLTLKGTAT